MADRYLADRYHDNRSYATDDNYGRGTHHAPSPEENDPLAELARLIGQTDPFSNFGLEHKSAPQRPAPVLPRSERPRYADEASNEPLADEPPPGPPAWMRNVAPRSEQPDYGQQDRYDTRSGGFEHANPAFPPRYDQPAQYDDPYAASQRFEQGGYEAGGARYDDVLYGQMPADQYPEPPYADDPRYAADGYADDGYEDEPPAKRRGGMMTVAAVLALAVLGTMGAYAYRSFVGSPRSGEPPVIKADAGPNKIMPANSQSGEGKQIYDRVGEKTAERMVSREEQPVEVATQAGSGPRVVFPPLTQNASPPTTAAVSPANRPTGPGVANGTLGGEEPRKIRTLTIRPDQPDVVVPAAAAQTARQAPPPPAAAPRTAPASSNAPMALAPQDAPAGQPAARARVASVNPSASAPASGAYVQLSSQKTEHDALASYKVLQGKYPGILGSRSAQVRRADLGSKGVYYRALVGPFGTNEEATQFCVNLQSAGGKCIVQRN